MTHQKDLRFIIEISLFEKEFIFHVRSSGLLVFQLNPLSVHGVIRRIEVLYQFFFLLTTLLPIVGGFLSPDRNWSLFTRKFLFFWFQIRIFLIFLFAIGFLDIGEFGRWEFESFFQSRIGQFSTENDLFPAQFLGPTEFGLCDPGSVHPNDPGLGLMFA